MDTEIRVDPFLKWAGGKRWLVSNHSSIFPSEYNRYIEPFLGSAAVYFFLQPKESILSDINSQLIDTYIAIKDDWQSVVNALKVHQNNHSKDYYYRVRSMKTRTNHTSAAKFIYLNRTCWNGLYRVNLDGEFNVPVGTKNNVLLETDNFQVVSMMLQKATILNDDFETTISKADEGDLIFVDPPYTVKHNANGFVKYNEKLFSWDDQLRLRECLEEAKDRGAYVVITNADHPSIRKLYKCFGNSISLARKSVISGKASARGKYTERIIKNY